MKREPGVIGGNVRRRAAFLRLVAFMPMNTLKLGCLAGKRIAGGKGDWSG